MKKSYYNVFITKPEFKLLYNTMTNSIACFTEEEAYEIERLLENTEEFEKEYPALFENMKQAGFIVEDVNELDFIILKNKLSTFEDGTYHITINPTLDCNLKCWYCSTEYKGAKHNGSMNEKTVEAVKKHLENLIVSRRVTHLHLDWFGGEPLMYFYEIMKPIASYAINLCDSNKVSFSHHVTTNSVFITDNMIEEFKDIRLNSFQIPLDGNESHHNLIKFSKDNSGTFTSIIRNINALTERIPNCHITLRINYDRKTLWGITDIIPLFSEMAKQHISVDFQRVWQINCDKRDYEQLETVKHIFNQNGLESGFWAYQPGSFNRCYSDRFHHYAINYDGKVVKCTAQDYGEDKIIGVLNLNGEITWNNRLLSQLFSHSTFDNERCLSCKSLPICMGPCIIKNYEARKNGTQIPCIFENAEYALESFIIEQAAKRGLLNK